jgi:hypothetical protein
MHQRKKRNHLTTPLKPLKKGHGASQPTLLDAENMDTSSRGSSVLPSARLPLPLPLSFSRPTADETHGETQPWVTVASQIQAGRGCCKTRPSHLLLCSSFFFFSLLDTTESSVFFPYTSFLQIFCFRRDVILLLVGVNWVIYASTELQIFSLCCNFSNNNN